MIQNTETPLDFIVEHSNHGPSPIWVWFFDIDGTLVDIAPTPDAIVVPKSLLAALTTLSRSAGHQLVLTSGRSVDDVKRRFPLPAPTIYGGNHGAEIAYPDHLAVSPQSQQARPDLDRLARALRDLTDRYPGTYLEDKRYSLSFHYRQVDPRRVEELAAALRRVSAPYGGQLQLKDAKMCLEVRPAGGPTKADAVKNILAWLRQSRPAVYQPIIFGDDLTDEDAFAAFPDATTVYVGESSVTRARFRIKNAHAVRELVQAVADRLPPVSP